ncbi:NAD(P)/FAD-dependent oxidoreductase [Cognatitamlana onchidii]|uniref:NAD(P)/FAD-dependent oxidoreductase n=1 Tax=Cognatitamlana onchidii TaxID=2562860 RepID=UPI0010A61E2A|nr:FAD-dependent oxidoreductase [Algibacter onchidii]
MNLSYWEIKTWLTNVDFCIVGSGIVGLNCAMHLKDRFPNAKILILEKGVLPQGASTKNAGFACFGSLSELLHDLESHSEEAVFNLVKQRVNGLRLLRQNLGDHVIDYKQLGGYELFVKSDLRLLETCLEKKDKINTLLKPIVKDYTFSFKDNIFGFKNINEPYIFNQFEGQLDTGKMMEALLHKVQSKGIKILNAIEVMRFSENCDAVHLNTSMCDIRCSKLIIATNGFAARLIKKQVKPARAQVLITKPINNLKIKGTFHLNKGYYYFRNIDNRILLGGGRHLDFKGEETTEFGQTKLIQNNLEDLLKSIILPNTPYNIEYSWSGIMGIGDQKEAIVEQLSDNVFCGVRLGGMGVAIGSAIGYELSKLIK